MKKYIGIASALVLAVVFLTPLAIAAEPAAPAVDQAATPNPTPVELGLPFVPGVSYQFNTGTARIVGEGTRGSSPWTLQGAVFGANSPLQKYWEGPNGEIFAQWSTATIGQWIPAAAKDVKTSLDQTLLIPFPFSLEVNEGEWEVGRFCYRVPPFDPIEVVLLGRILTSQAIRDRYDQFRLPVGRDFPCLNGAGYGVIEIYEDWGTLSMPERVFFQLLWSRGVGVIEFLIGDEKTKTSKEVAWLVSYQKTGQDVNPQGGKTATTWGKIKKP